MDEYPVELSLTTAKRHFFDVTEDERNLRIEHQRLIRAHIFECIGLNKKEAVYEVPPSLSGAYANYDVNEIALWLLKQCRQGGYSVELVSANPPTIRVWGWYVQDWLSQNRPEEVRVRGPMSVASGKTAAAKKPARITPEQASAIAQEGLLSRHLEQRFSQLKK